MPRVNGSDTISNFDGWKDDIVRLTDFDKLSEILLKEAKIAEKDQGPLVLFPFGPKLHTFSAGCTLASMESVDSWAVYPIPDGYPVDYSSGTAITYWMEVT